MNSGKRQLEKRTALTAYLSSITGFRSCSSYVPPDGVHAEIVRERTGRSVVLRAAIGNGRYYSKIYWHKGFVSRLKDLSQALAAWGFRPLMLVGKSSGEIR